MAKVTPPAFTYAFFDDIRNQINVHYDSSRHADRDGNEPCEDEYCKVTEDHFEMLDAMIDALSPLLFKFVTTFDFSDHDSFDDLRSRMSRLAHHIHACGQRNTREPIVESQV